MNTKSYIIVFAPVFEDDETQITDTTYYRQDEDGYMDETFEESEALRLNNWEAELICQKYGGYIQEV